MPKLRDGHAPGHVRGAAADAFQAWMEWGSGPEPTVEYEIGYVAHQIPITRVCGLVWNCTDIVPGDLFHELQDCAEGSDEPAIKSRTYAACARMIVANIKNSAAAA